MSLPIIFGFILVGLILTYIGGMIITVVAFRRSVVWGLGTILLPLVGVIVVFRQWTEAKPGFLLALLGLTLAVGPFALGDVRDQLQKELVSKFPQASGVTAGLQDKLQKLEKNLPQTPAETVPSVATQTAQIDQLDQEISELTTALGREYALLTERKKTLKTNVPEEVRAFNEAAAVYSQRNTMLKTKREERERLGAAR